MKKRFLTFILTITAMLTCIFSLTACGGNNETDTIIDEGSKLIPSEGLEYVLNSDGQSYSVAGIGTCEDTNIIIPSTYENKPVTSIGDRAFYCCISLTSIVIPNSVTSISEDAFAYCYSLTSVVIGDSVTSIGDWAFWDCDSLTSIYYNGTIDEWVQIEFNNSHSNPLCYANNLYINDKLITEAVLTTATQISNYALCCCSSLTSIEIPNNVKSIGDRAFAYCDSLTSIMVDENNENYKSIDGNLYSKDGKTLIQYAIGKTDTAFTIPNSVTSIGSHAFGNCVSLTSVVIGDSVTSIGSCAFTDCSSLTSVVIPDSVTSIGEYPFYECYSLTSIKYRGSQAQWSDIDKGDDWNYKTGNYTITYNYTGE